VIAMGHLTRGCQLTTFPGVNGKQTREVPTVSSVRGHRCIEARISDEVDTKVIAAIAGDATNDAFNIVPEIGLPDGVRELVNLRRR
jgi:hypothetical protein